MPAKKAKTENKLAAYGVSDGTIVDLAEKNMEAKKLVPLLQAKPCKTPEQYKWASEQLANLRAIRQTLDDSRTSITKPMNAAKRAVDALFAPIKMFDQCIEILREKVTAYDLVQLQAESAALKLAADAAQRGDIAAAGAAIDSLSVAVEGAGHSPSRTLSYYLTSMSEVPLDLVILDHDAIKARIREWEKSGSTEVLEIPGLKFELAVKIRAKPV